MGSSDAPPLHQGVDTGHGAGRGRLGANTRACEVDDRGCAGLGRLKQATQRLHNLCTAREFAYHGRIGPRRVPISLTRAVEHEWQAAFGKSASDRVVASDAVLAVEHARGEFWLVGGVPSLAFIRRALNLGSGSPQDNLETMGDERLVLDHEDRIAGKRRFLHEWSSARGHAHLPKAPLTQWRLLTAIRLRCLEPRSHPRTQHAVNGLGADRSARSEGCCVRRPRAHE